MKVTNKIIGKVEMKGWNDSGATWAIQSTDSDGYCRTENYDKKVFTLKKAFELHAQIYENF